MKTLISHVHGVDIHLDDGFIKFGSAYVFPISKAGAIITGFEEAVRIHKEQQAELKRRQLELKLEDIAPGAKLRNGYIKEKVA